MELKCELSTRAKVLKYGLTNSTNLTLHDGIEMD